MLEPMESADQLPIGWGDDQEAGWYRLRRRGDEARFGYQVGPQSWKQYLHAARLRLWSARRKGNGFKIDAEAAEEPPRYAFLGVRACDLAAIRRLDEVLMGEGAFKDPPYVRRREGALLIAAACTEGGATCFCVSMGTGPAPTQGYDLALTEVLTKREHYFVMDVGSRRGEEAIAPLKPPAASAAQVAAARAAVKRAAGQMGRSLQLAGLKELFYRNYENPRWDAVARRCLTCANCTMVCPTCFCTTVEDQTDLVGGRAERARLWDSCFTMEFSYIHGGSVRTSPMARYRQWLTHKLATWIDQFGAPGCVGCGRCITWCPVGIDLTEEARAIRDLSASADARESSHDQA
jgi:ferredoxin